MWSGESMKTWVRDWVAKAAWTTTGFLQSAGDIWTAPGRGTEAAAAAAPTSCCSDRTDCPGCSAGATPAPTLGGLPGSGRSSSSCGRRRSRRPRTCSGGWERYSKGAGRAHLLHLLLCCDVVCCCCCCSCLFPCNHYSSAAASKRKCFFHGFIDILICITYYHILHSFCKLAVCVHVPPLTVFTSLRPTGVAPLHVRFVPCRAVPLRGAAVCHLAQENILAHLIHPQTGQLY